MREHGGTYSTDAELITCEPFRSWCPLYFPNFDLSTRTRASCSRRASSGCSRTGRCPLSSCYSRARGRGGNHRRCTHDGAALSPLFAGLLFARPSLVDAPFYIAGTLKIACDLLLFHAFRSVKPPEEATRAI
jgi:hypothetical protein